MSTDDKRPPVSEPVEIPKPPAEPVAVQPEPPVVSTKEPEELDSDLLEPDSSPEPVTSETEPQFTSEGKDPQRTPTDLNLRAVPGTPDQLEDSSPSVSLPSVKSQEQSSSNQPRKRLPDGLLPVKVGLGIIFWVLVLMIYTTYRNSNSNEPNTDDAVQTDAAAEESTSTAEELEEAPVEKTQPTEEAPVEKTQPTEEDPVEEVLEQEPKPQPKPEEKPAKCTWELAKQKFPKEAEAVEAKITAFNAEAKAKALAMLVGAPEAKVASEPIGLKPLGKRDLKYYTDQIKATVSTDGKCTPTTKEDRQEIKVGDFSGNWSTILGVAGIIISTGIEEADARDSKTADADAQGDRLDPSYLSKFGDEEELIARFKSICENEEKLKSMLSWAVPLLPSVVDKKFHPRLREWVKQWYIVSLTNMRSLNRKVEAYDAQKGEDDSNYYSGKHLFREGWLLRRWIAAGGGKAGDEFILVYRFWIVQLAKTLDMPEAQRWSKRVRKKMRKTTTLKFKGWYLSQL